MSFASVNIIGFINQITNFGANAVRYGTYFLS